MKKILDSYKHVLFLIKMRALPHKEGVGEKRTATTFGHCAFDPHRHLLADTYRHITDSQYRLEPAQKHSLTAGTLVGRQLRSQGTGEISLCVKLILYCPS